MHYSQLHWCSKSSPPVYLGRWLSVQWAIWETHSCGHGPLSRPSDVLYRMLLAIVLLERSFLGVNCEFDCLFPPKDFGFVEVIKWFLCYRRSCHLDALRGSFDWVSHFVCLPRTSILPWLVNATSTLIPWNTWHVWYLSRKCAVLPAQVVKSMDHLLRGVPIPPAFGTGPLQALITQVRADWKFHRDIWLFIYDQPWL